MKVVINKCFGGFGLSPAGVRRLAELNGRQCFFFHNEIHHREYRPIDEKKINTVFWLAFDIPNPNEVLRNSKTWHEMSQEERVAANKLHSKHDLTSRPEDRADPKLIQVVEELGDAANGKYSKLRVVEIPDGTEWEIDEYDGMESISEKHRSWG